MLHTIRNEYICVQVAEKGAELQSILACDGTEYLWQGDPKYWSDRALNIFPYVARLTEGKYMLDGEIYKMDIHGFAPSSQFICREVKADRLILELTDNEEIRRQYPRSFCFRVIYTLRKKTLEITYEVENQDEKTMYFGLGGHPGFNVPLTGGGSFEDYELYFFSPCQPRRVGFTPACFLDGTDAPFPLQDNIKLPLRHDMFNDDAIVLKDMCRRVTLQSRKDSHSITVSFPQMPYLGIWHTPHTDAPYVCIEPWCSLPATQNCMTVLEEQTNLLRLDAGHVYRNRWTIEIDY